MKKPNHSDLVEKASKWLRYQGCAVVITEMSCTREEPDAIGFIYGHSIVVECKISRSDFLSDRRKRALKYFVGMGTKRYYLIPKGLVHEYEIPDKYGLLEYIDGRSHPKIVKKAEPFREKRNTIQEISLLCSAFRRIRGNREGISVKVYQYESGKRATLGILKE